MKTVMQFKFFQVPTRDPGAAADELNGFLRSHCFVADHGCMLKPPSIHSRPSKSSARDLQTSRELFGQETSSSPNVVGHAHCRREPSCLKFSEIVAEPSQDSLQVLNNLIVGLGSGFRHPGSSDTFELKYLLNAGNGKMMSCTIV